MNEFLYNFKINDPFNKQDSLYRKIQLSLFIALCATHA